MTVIQSVYEMPPARLEDRLNACLMVPDIAERLYHARSLWRMGGEAPPWHSLTKLQQYEYRQEIERLIREERGEQ